MTITLSTIKYFTHYYVYYGTGSSETGFPQDAVITCYAENEVRVGSLNFHPNGVPIPQDQISPVAGISLNFRLNRFADVMTIVKDEKPLYLCFDPLKNAGHLGTGSEPIGE
jgi:hypothetical protein